MSYGVEINDEKGRNIVETFHGTYAIDTISVSSGGSRSYSLSAGEYLQACYVPSTITKRGGVGGCRVSGNTVIWDTSDGGSAGHIIVLKGKNK